MVAQVTGTDIHAETGGLPGGGVVLPPSSLVKRKTPSSSRAETGPTSRGRAGRELGHRLTAWQTISGVNLGWLLASLVFMGATILIGVVRWRIVLDVRVFASVRPRGGHLAGGPFFQFPSARINRR